MSRIHVLPPDLINKIAAGEVVERPASVVKELVENALDAGATRVEIELEDGGRGLVQVVDDGVGMSAEDAQLCLERHATSKLRTAEDLFRIGSFGFRGEAVPAIASVSRLTLITCERGALQGTRIEIESGTLLESGPCGAPAGTRFEVRDLFHATPARRKFLKRPETEVGHVADAVTRLALARPDVTFQLRSGGRMTFQAPATTDLRERVAAAVGKDVFPHLLPVEHGAGALRIHGLAASPDWSTSSNRAIYLYVNGRFVRDRQVQHAIVRAYADVLPPGRMPAVALFVEIPPGEVDVNVHPQKLEVRFADGRGVYDAVLRAVSSALRTTDWLTANPRPAGAPAGAAPLRQEPFGWRPAPVSPPAGAGGPGVREAAAALWPRAGDAELVAPAGDGEADLPPAGYFSALRVIGQLARTYIVCEAPGGTLVVIDQHAAHERLTFDRLRTAHRERRSAGQPFLFPATLELPVPEARALAEHLPALADLGFDLEPFGGTTFALKSVPAPLVGTEYARVLADLARELAAVGQGRALEDATTDMLATMACHASVRAHQSLGSEEARALLDQLDAIDFKSRCPHGRPVVAEISLADLERRVGRR